MRLLIIPGIIYLTKLELSNLFINRYDLMRMYVSKTKIKRCIILLHAIWLCHLATVLHNNITGDFGVVIAYQTDSSDAHICQDNDRKANCGNSTSNCPKGVLALVTQSETSSKTIAFTNSARKSWHLVVFYFYNFKILKLNRRRF